MRRNYVGVARAEQVFDELRPLVDKLRAMQHQYKPFGPDYCALAVALEGMDTAAYHFTKRPGFYGASGKHQ
ncbi:MAG TPA: hypothetical protein VHV27_09960 [Phenylobacterium sp.]|nr:hypothetical protein [Phenylobacterium sp.]